MEATKKAMTLSDFMLVEPGEVFASGTAVDAADGLNMTGSGKKLRWLAVKGYGQDWVIYCHASTLSDDCILSNGDKVQSEMYIRRLVPCDDEVFERYRH